MRKTYILPGMGADATMYGGPWRDLDNFIYLDWPVYNGEKTLGEVAEKLIKVHQIEQGDIVGGSSMGGMVALEIAECLSTPHVVLIGSAMHPDEINPFLTMLAPLAKVTPIKLAQAISGPSVSSLGNIGAIMMKADPEFLQAMCVAISKWKGSEFPLSKIARIHGTRDHVIRCPEHCHRIEGAGHLLAMTHPDECVRWIKLLEQEIGAL